MLRREPLDMSSQRSKQKIKRRICMLGTVMSGKSTIASGIVVTCESMSALMPDFYCYVLPESTHILVDANNLRRGKFPIKTDPYAPRPFESGLVICERGWKEKRVQVPLCDIAGEISDQISPYNPGLNPLERRAQHINQQIISYIRDSNGFIVALPANEALMMKDSASKTDADAYTYHILSQVIEYKKRNKRSPKLEHIFVVITKWDEVKDLARDYGMDVYDTSQNGLYRYMVNGFPSLSMLLKPLVEQEMVHFYRSYFEIRRDNNNEKIKYPGTKSDYIATFEDPSSDVRWRPKYAEQEYVQLVKDIGGMAK